MPTLYTMAGTCALAPNIAIAWLRAPVEIENLPRGANRGADYLRLNPQGKVPAVRMDDGEVLTEAAAILAWLGATWGDPRWARDAQDGWREAEALSYMTSEVHADFGGHFGTARFADAEPCQAEVKRHTYDKIAGHFRRMAATLEANGGEWYLGERSFADAYLYTVTRWAGLTPVPLADTPTLVDHRLRMEADAGVRLALGRQGMKPLGAEG